MDSDQLKQIRLLLVDDETEFRNTLAKRLLKRGLSSLHAPDGETCLSVMAEQSVDVVVMDVMMPGISGIDALLKIKSTTMKQKLSFSQATQTHRMVWRG
jgi:two-component system NtrC family sensor kinase